MDAGLNRSSKTRAGSGYLAQCVKLEKRWGSIDRAEMTAPQSRTGSRDRLTTTMVLDERET